MIASNFLHAYIVVQVENPEAENTAYKVGEAHRSLVLLQQLRLRSGGGCPAVLYQIIPTQLMDVNIKHAYIHTCIFMCTLLHNV